MDPIPFENPTPRSVTRALRHGGMQQCPACGQSGLYRAFLKVRDTCAGCGEALHHQRADDAPAYFTMAVVAHVVIGGILALEQAFQPHGVETWIQLAIWLPMTVGLSLLLLPRIKGMLVGLQWALRMHGFGGEPELPVPEPLPAALEPRRHEVRS